MSKISKMIEKEMKKSNPSYMITSKERALQKRELSRIMKEHDVQSVSLNEDTGEVWFTLHGGHYRCLYERAENGTFHIRIGTETSYSKDFMKALYDSELISSEGKILFDYSY